MTTPKYTYQQILEQVLKCIDYSGSSQTFIHEFFNLCEQQAMLKVIELMEENDREEFKKSLETSASPEEMEKILSEKIDKDTYTKQLNIVFENSFKEYILEIRPTLNESQQEKLTEFFKTLE